MGGREGHIGKFEIPDGEMGRQHVVGLAREYDMAGSSSVKQYDLGSSSSNDAALPDPDDPGRDGGRTDPGREHR
ncbi:hypothetical protein ACH4U5_31615 [Streptomyces sp. NPDC020858]|uniref:hypothetical protein n=1 Tax=Streptomyces sp. NPDC020858 TaxID=3365097 RepID=UPI0037A1A990